MIRRLKRVAISRLINLFVSPNVIGWVGFQRETDFDESGHFLA